LFPDDRFDPRTQQQWSNLQEHDAVLAAAISSSRISGVLIGDVQGARDSIILDTLRSPLRLYGIDTNCQACLAGVPIVAAAADSSPCLDVIGVQLGSFDPSLTMPFDVWTNVHSSFWKIFPFRSTPWTVMLGANGRWMGMWLGMSDSIGHVVAAHAREACWPTATGRDVGEARLLARSGSAREGAWH